MADTILKPQASIQTDPEWELETIDPGTAKAYLDRNISNRKLSKPTVERYRRDMKSGRWRVTADPIRFNTDGQLFDGQHRLAACIAADHPFTTLVARNLDNDVVNVIDSGRSRKAHDMLALHGYNNSFLLASAARWLLVMRYGLHSSSESSLVLKPSHEEILDVVERHPGLEDSCKICAKPKGALPSLLSAIHYVGVNLLNKPEEAEAFARVFVTGNPYYTKDDPALKLREMVLADNLRGVQPKPRTSYINMIYVWNAFAKGRSIPTFRPPAVIAIEGLKTTAI